MEKRKRKITVIAGAAAGILLIAAAILLYIFLLTPGSPRPANVVISPSPQSSAQTGASPSPSDTATDEDISPAAPEPFVYVKDGQVYMASSENTKYLGGYKDMAGCYSLQTALSGDKRYLFYLTGYDVYKGSGTLMRIATDAITAPLKVAENVCAVKISNDGKRALYYTDMKGSTGNLYLWREGKSQLVAESVTDSAISPRSKYVSYIVDSGNEQKFYLKKENSEAVLVKTIPSTPASKQFERDRIQVSTLDDKGAQLYSLVPKGQNSGPVYLYTSGGNTEELGDKTIEAMFGSLDDIMYSEWVTGGVNNKHILYYKGPGMKPVTLSDKLSHMEFADKDITENDKRFLLAESVSDASLGAKLYEQYINGNKTFIADTDGSILVNSRFDCIAYEREEGLYVSTKTDKGWTEKFLSKFEYDEGNNSSLREEFDKSGEYLYYYDDQNNGPLFRYSARTGQIIKIIDEPQNFFALKESSYVTANGTAYRINGDGTPEKIGTGIIEIRQTNGGIYLLTDDFNGKIVFLADNTDKGNTIDSFASRGYISNNFSYAYTGNEISGYIESHEPLGENTDNAIDILSEEVYYCLGNLNGNSDGYPEPLSIDEAEALIGKLFEKTGLDPDQINLLQKMKEGLDKYGLWLEGDTTQKDATVKSLQEVYDAYYYYEYGPPPDEDTGCDD